MRCLQITIKYRSKSKSKKMNTRSSPSHRRRNLHNQKWKKGYPLIVHRIPQLKSHQSTSFKNPMPPQRRSPLTNISNLLLLDPCQPRLLRCLPLDHPHVLSCVFNHCSRGHEGAVGGDFGGFCVSVVGRCVSCCGDRGRQSTGEGGEEIRGEKGGGGGERTLHAAEQPSRTSPRGGG